MPSSSAFRGLRHGVWMGWHDNSPLTDVTGSGLPAASWSETMNNQRAWEEPSETPLKAEYRRPGRNNGIHTHRILRIGIGPRR